MDTVRFDAKGQVVIPRRLRQEFKIKEGTKARIVSSADGILLKPSYTNTKILRGKYKHLPLMETLKEMKREERNR